MTCASKASDNSVRSFKNKRIEARQQMTGGMMVSHRIKGRATPFQADVPSLQTEFMVRE